MAKKKRMTVAEKKMNAKVREELRAAGVIPPVKPKLNRKKFAEEVIKGYQDNLNTYSDIRFLMEGISCMLPSLEPRFKRQISSEEVGVLKALKIALGIKAFIEEKKEAGEEKYSPMELYEKVIKPIRKL